MEPTFVGRFRGNDCVGTTNRRVAADEEFTQRERDIIAALRANNLEALNAALRAGDRNASPDPTPAEEALRAGVDLMNQPPETEIEKAQRSSVWPLGSSMSSEAYVEKGTRDFVAASDARRGRKPVPTADELARLSPTQRFIEASKRMRGQ